MWMNIFTAAFVASHATLYVYALRHQDRPFWYGFIHCFGGRR